MFIVQDIFIIILQETTITKKKKEKKKTIYARIPTNGDM